MNKCPVCGSTRLRKLNSKEMRCDKCGYIHSEVKRAKVVISKTGAIDENWWMR